MKEKLTSLINVSSYRTVIISILFVIAAFGALYNIATQWPGIDYWRPWVVTGTVLNGSFDDVYSRSAREHIYKAVMPNYSITNSSDREHEAARVSAAFDRDFLGYYGLDIVHTPLFLSIIRVINTGNYERDYLVFAAFSVACFFASVIAICLLAGLSIPVSLVTAGALALTLDSEANEMRILSVTNIQLAMIAVFLLLQRRQSLWNDIMSGFILAFGILFKPNTALLAVAIIMTWIGDRRLRALLNVSVGLILGVFTAIILPSVLFPAATWSNWFGIVPELLGSVQPLGLGNYSLSAIITEYIGYNASPTLLALGLIVFGAAALKPLWSERHYQAAKQEPFKRTFFGISAGALLLLISSRLVWIHYTILAIPALILFLCSMLEQPVMRPRSWLWLAILPLTSGFSTLKIFGVTTVWIALAMDLSLIVLFMHVTESLQLINQDIIQQQEIG